MRRIYLKRILSASMAVVMAVTMAGCGCGKKKTGSTEEQASHDASAYVFKDNPIDLGESIDTSSISALGKFGDKIYAVGTAVSDEGNNKTTVFTFDKDGSNLNTIDLANSGNLLLYNAALTDDGSIYTLEVQYAGYMGGGDFEFDQGLDGSSPIILEDGNSIEIEDSESVEDDVTQYSGEDEEEALSDDSEADEEGTSDDAASTSQDATEDTNTTSSEGGEGDVIMPSDTDTGVDMSSSSNVDSDTYYMVKYDNNGTEVWRQEIDSTTDSYYYVNSFIAADNDTLLVSDTNGVHKYSTADGSKTADIAFDNADTEYGFSAYVYKLGDGSFGALVNGSEQTFYKVDLKGEKATEVGTVDSTFYDYSFYSGAGSHDLFASGSEGIYTYKLGDEKVSMILNFVDSDIDTYGVSQMVAISDTEIIALIPTEDMKYNLTYLTKVDPKTVSERQQIVLGCNYIDYDVRAQIIKFNKTNDKYRIVISDYSKYDSDSEMSGGANKLNTDIVSGNAPDILVLDSDMPVDSYISKGLFEDMTDYFKNDEELSKVKYMDHVMEAFKNDGKMYKLIPSFYVETVVAATDDVGNDDYTWTIDELEKLVKAKNIEHKNIFGPLTRDEVLEMALSLSGSQYIDWSTLTCSYDSEAFTHLLEFVNEFPEELSEDDYNYETAALYRTDKALAERLYLYAFSDYNYEAKGTFGKPIKTVGFPSDNGSGSALYPNLQLTMSSSSKVKDGCWEFMRYFLSDEYQKTIDGAWPVSMTKMDELSEKAKKKPTYIDENGKEVEYDDTWYVGDTEVIVDPMTDDEVNEVMNFLNSIDQVGNANEAVTSIIFEEAAAYFSGQKTAAEVADIIQSRVQIYVNEIS
ncbi:ABC transporter substrate-binding protein [Butyrivibrio sp. WCD2001]|uniref:ABC transporter substrate-binding protein n=1 Tax=Butyrivibrio sp. WCD2001 TaxID=1280681 RepID=UPI000421C468|nr:extracellular solute-binding protein [Butyrivibrio sp. WCD2001]